MSGTVLSGNILLFGTVLSGPVLSGTVLSVHPSFLEVHFCVNVPINFTLRFQIGLSCNSFLLNYVEIFTIMLLIVTRD